MTSGRQVSIVEVGPRDGLQNDPRVFPADARARFVDDLVEAGVPVVEAGSFVSPKVVPQLADSDRVFAAIERRPNVRYVALVPNETGYDRARAAGVDSIALFASATEAFSQANLRASIDESFARFAPVAQRAKDDGVWVRGYVSVAFACPYSGPTDPAQAAAVADRLLALGCDEVSIADTIGVATPDDVARLLEVVQKSIAVNRLALHFHDTHGHALANVDAGLEAGITTFDSAAGGMGGCPFAPGAPGNLATEALVEHLTATGIETGVRVSAVRTAVDRLNASAIASHTA
jgi:isopropylmalate/homocitrate/citramalate synthase